MRLPTKAELDSIVDHYKDKDHGNWSSPTINTKVFPDTPDYSFWTASEYADLAGSAWYVFFYAGSGFWSGVNELTFVRCVR
jgi:hypothetical protein